jgi:hypothetical protein
MRNDTSNTNRVRYESDAIQPLIFDIIGPTIIHLYRNEDGVIKVGVYAPPCEDHHANLLTDSNDVSMEPIDPMMDSITYKFSKHDAPTPAHSFKLNSSKDVLLISDPRSPVDPDECHMVLSLPCPDQIWPLIPEHVWIHQGPSTVFVDNPDPDKGLGSKNDPPYKNIVNSHRARGLRLAYYTCNGNPELVQTPLPDNPVNLNVHSDAVGFHADPINLPHYHMTVRFASNRASDDEHHEDAFNCFAALRNTLDNMPSRSDGSKFDTCKWRVDFSDIPTKSGLSREEFLFTVSGKRPNDCGSQTMVVQDPEFDERKKATK